MYKGMGQYISGQLMSLYLGYVSFDFVGGGVLDSILY